MAPWSCEACPRGSEIADEDAGRLLNAILDGGISLIDTSSSAMSSPTSARS
jgi:aryl-alcohol dehydrogenase-like predicted oxidoreductase